jgi:hypothetical protein
VIGLFIRKSNTLMHDFFIRSDSVIVASGVVMEKSDDPLVLIANVLNKVREDKGGDVKD